MSSCSAIAACNSRHSFYGGINDEFGDWQQPLAEATRSPSCPVAADEPLHSAGDAPRARRLLDTLRIRAAAAMRLSKEPCAITMKAERCCGSNMKRSCRSRCGKENESWLRRGPNSDSSARPARTAWRAGNRRSGGVGGCGGCASRRSLRCVRYIIDRIKHSVPSGRRSTTEGDSGWVNCEQCAAAPGSHQHAKR